LGIFSSIIETIVKIVWPWIIENVWPVIQQQVISIFIEALGWLTKQIKKLFGSKSKERAEQAEEKAESAEQKAKSTSNEQEANSYRAEAAVWREVAEQYRQDLEDMKQKITELEAEAKSDTKNKIKKLNPSLDLSSKAPSLSLDGATYQLPKIK